VDRQVYLPIIIFFVSARTNKRHHHLVNARARGKAGDEGTDQDLDDKSQFFDVFLVL
jgi:hypothetical protein